MFVSVFLVVVVSILARLLSGSPGVKVRSVLPHANSARARCATATRYYDLIRDVMSSDCIYYGTGTSTSVGCPDHLGHFFCLVYVGCGGQLGHFFYLISRPVGIFLLMGVWTSWDITSIECPGKLGHFFCWVSRLVGTCFLLGAWMSLF